MCPIVSNFINTGLNPVPSMCPNSVCLSQTIIATVCQQTTPPFVPKSWSVSKPLSFFVLLSRLSLDFYNSGILILSHRSTCNMSQSIARQSRICVLTLHLPSYPSHWPTTSFISCLSTESNQISGGANWYKHPLSPESDGDRNHGKQIRETDSKPGRNKLK